MSEQVPPTQELHEHPVHLDRPVVVGIGASAGGLEAISHLVRGVPKDPGMSFVIIQHLDPTHKSALVDILSRRTQLSVMEVLEDTEVQANYVYVIPPGQYLSIKDCVLRLSEPQDPRGSRMAIDYFLTSLAEDACEFGIGVVLSGTGTDGTAGLQSIKHYGGLTVVQDPDEAEHAGMPQSAIDSVHIDYVLPASAMGARLERYIAFAMRHGPLSAQSIAKARQSDLLPILDLLRKHIGHDFRRYRKSTLMRRIQRRMSLHQLTDLSDYLALLNDNAIERDALRCDLLIGVTRFFRNPEAWVFLGKKVLAPMMSQERNTPIRVWCAGCATGEEAYSVAMLLIEQAGTSSRQRHFQIFATDVADDALSYARRGLYPEAIMKDVPLERLRRFFTKEAHGYRVSTQLRESVVFAKQNVLAQPPFTNLDLILCRNLLIYLEREAQERVVSVFQFALKDGGVLFQGSSETIGLLSDLFSPVSKKHRIHRRNELKAWPPAGADYEANVQPLPEFAVSKRGAKPGKEHATGIAAAVHREMLQQLGHGVIVCNRNSRVLFADGDADSYVQFGLGESSAELPDLMEIARKGVKAKLRASLRRIWNGESSHRVDARVHRDGKFHACELQLSRLPGRPDDDPAVMIIFTPTKTTPPSGKVSSDAASVLKPLASDLTSSSFEAEQSLAEVEHELSITREQLNSSIADLESANEELKAANEEAMTMNEELQSSNEELETSKEELQSLNEELTTLNSQLEIKVGELEEITDDLQNLLSSSDVPTVFLDTHFRIRRYTPSCADLFHFISGDLGRPLQDIKPCFEDPDLLQDAKAVLHDLQPRERNVITVRGDRRYRRRMLPYRTEDNRIQGVVMTFTDMTDLLSSQEQLLRQLAENQVIYTTSPVGLAFLDTDLTYISANAHIAEIDGAAVEDHLGRKVDEVLPPELAKQVRGYCEQVIRTGEGIFDLEIVGQTAATDDDRVYLVSYVPVADDAGDLLGINIVVSDITDRTRREANLAFLAELQSALSRLHRVDTLLSVACKSAAEHLRLARCFVMEVQDDSRTATVLHDHVADGNAALFGDQALKDFLTSEEQRALSNGDVIAVDSLEQRIAHPDQKARYAELGNGAFCAVAFVRDGQARFIVAVLKSQPHRWTPDESQLLAEIAQRLGLSLERSRTEKSLADAKARLDLSLEVGNIAVWSWDIDTRTVSPNSRLMQFFGFDEHARPGLEDFIERVDPAAQQGVAIAVERSMRFGEDYDQEYSINLADGAVRYVRARGAVRRLADGQAKDFFGVMVDISDRKRDELKLADREAHLRRVIDNTMNYIGELDVEGTLLEVNQVALDMGGMPRGAVVGIPFWECGWWAFDEHVVARLKRAITEVSNGKTVRYDTQVRTADGTLKMIDFSLCPVTGPSGVVSYLIASGVDVTEKYQAQLALQEKEKLLRLALHSGGMAAWEWRPDSMRWEPELYELLGLPRSSTPSVDRFFAAVHPDDLPGLEAAWQQTSAGSKNFHHEFRIVRPDKEVRWLVGTGIITEDEQGTVSSVAGLNWDITDLKAKEAEAALSKERLEIAASAAGFANFHVDLDSGDVVWSEQMEVLTGLPLSAHQDLIVGEVPAFVHADDRDKVSSYLEEVLNDLEIADHSIDHRITRPCGEVRHVRLQSRSVLEGSGKRRRIKAIVGTLLDITAHREYEANLERERHRALVASESKSEFVANMSHEIRTPMTAVLGCAQLLSAMEHDPVKADHLRAIKRNGDFLLAIINDILDLSKIEAGKLDISPVRFRPHELVSDVLSMMNVRASERGIGLTLSYDSAIPEYIHSDARRLKQILLNLIGNAIKFTKEGGVTITIRYLEAPLEDLEFDITDTGIGMTDEQQACVFDPFTQGDQSITREFEGSGLGLAICRRLVSMLGGDISVKSQFGRGSTFVFSISTGNSDTTPLIDPGVDFITDSHKHESEPPHLDCRVLVVDDRRDIRQIATHFLEDAGASVEQADDGQTAVERVIQALTDACALPDVILLDMHMPRLDGYQTVSKLRALGYTKPIIALTAAAMDKDRDRGLAAGCDAYLTKPIDSVALLRTVEELTRKPTQQAEYLRKVLIAEDSLDAAEALRRLLAAKGIESVVTHTGREAINQAMSTMPEAVLLDLNLPDMTGFDVLANLKGVAQLAGTRFIALTGHVQEKDIKRCREAGFAHHLGKPVDVERLFAVLEA